MSDEIKTTSDPAGLARLARETFVEAYADDLDRDVLERYADLAFVPELMGELRSGGTAVRVVLAHGEPVAYATLRADEAWTDPTSRLGRIYVRADHRRRGLGRALMTWAVHTARAGGASTLCLGVWERNARAIAFYEAMGFVARGEETFVLEGDVQRDVVMCRPLS